MSTLQVNAINENTSGNGVNIDSFFVGDGILMSPQTISATRTIDSDKNAMLIGPINVSGTITIAGNLEVL